MLTGIAAALGGAALSGYFGYLANKQNAKLNQKRWEASIELANTAHQREVNDLRAAGLNPILSAGTAGASVPSQNPAEMNNPLENLSGLAASLNAAASADLNTANVNKLKAEVAKANFLENFYKSPVGQGILMQKEIKDASPDNPTQAAGMLTTGLITKAKSAGSDSGYHGAEIFRPGRPRMNATYKKAWDMKYRNPGFLTDYLNGGNTSNPPKVKR